MDAVSAKKDTAATSAAPVQTLGEAACAFICGKLQAAIKARGRASLMVSGGSSPKPLFAALSAQDIAWEKVTISLVDERWVEPGEAGSNETFIKEHLLIGRAAEASFISLKSAHKTVEAGLEVIEARFANIPRPFDVCVMGMGLDGHTASWFPNAKGREAAMAADNNARFGYVDAAGCEGAGDFTDRITLTLTAVMDSGSLVLFIPGEPKSKLFASLPKDTFHSAPVAALKLAGERLAVFTGPS